MFIEYDSIEYIVEFEFGFLLMQVVVNNVVFGIDGDCGGECVCGICYVIVIDEWFGKIGEINDVEEQMLFMILEWVEIFWLGCQI